MRHYHSLLLCAYEQVVACMDALETGLSVVDVVVAAAIVAVEYAD